ncbi:hypothetical protein [Labrenzia sp. DG1229]|uniref:hypothetical protein n=1 Tax=Labrenzia sp. DG1229 TaxID=681847 RepID=UPI00048E4A5D|nr:hypothetical protein [Labrenzia sp. DG1229]
MRKWFGLALVFLAVFAAGGTSAALAQSTFQVKPDGVVEILRSKKSIENESAKFGSVKVAAEVGESEDNVLIYFAPDNGGAFTDTVTYTLSGDTQSATVSVQEDYGPWGSQEVYTESFKAVFILFILAVLVESGLALLFRWRPYMRHFNTSALNPLVGFAFSLLLVWGVFKLDVVTDLFNIYTQPSKMLDGQVIGFILTAMIVAGGSKGVNKLLRTLGLRSLDIPEEVTGPRDETKAWISVKLTRKNAVGPVSVLYGPEDAMSVIGTISGDGELRGFKTLFFRDSSRFPQSGGYTVTAGETCSAVLQGFDKDGNDIENPLKWGPHKIGKRAIIDLDITI